jgi:hypothetical protein
MWGFAKIIMAMTVWWLSACSAACDNLTILRHGELRWPVMPRPGAGAIGRACHAVGISLGTNQSRETPTRPGGTRQNRVTGGFLLRGLGCFLLDAGVADPPVICTTFLIGLYFSSGGDRYYHRCAALLRWHSSSMRRVQ